MVHDFKRLPPYSEEAEKSVLGSVLLNAEKVMDLCLEAGLTPESFHVHPHRAIYEACVDMWRDSRPIDLMTVGEKLRVRNALDGIGGNTFLESLIDATPTAAHSEYYIQVVFQKHLLRKVIECAREAEDDCYKDDDARKVVSRAEQSFLSIADLKAAGESWPDVVQGNMARIKAIADGRGSFAGIPSGFRNVDEVLLGFKESEMIVLAARPSMGKTALAMNIVERIALGKTTDRQPKAVGVFSLEMSTDMLVLRMLCSHTRVPTHVLTKGLISETQTSHIKQAADILGRAPICVDDAGGPDIDTLRAKARRMKKKFGVAIIFIDYLQLIGARGFERKSRNEEVATVSAGLKAMAKELRIPVVVLSQLSRASEMKGQRKPRLSDLRDSGSIEQDADVVCLLRRPCKLSKDEESDDPTLAVVEVAKHRNGPTGEIRLNFEDEYTRFEDRSHGVDDHSFMIPEDAGHEEPLPV